MVNNFFFINKKVIIKIAKKNTTENNVKKKFTFNKKIKKMKIIVRLAVITNNGYIVLSVNLGT
jgi:hypothetical protein